MSPEQETTSAFLYPASDIFSVGCVLFEMLAGLPYKQARRRKQGLTDLRPDVSPWLVELTTAALAIQPDDRLADGEAMGRMLAEAQAKAKAEAEERTREALRARLAEEERLHQEAEEQARQATAQLEAAQQAEQRRQAEAVELTRREAALQAQEEAARAARQRAEAADTRASPAGEQARRAGAPKGSAGGEKRRLPWALIGLVGLVLAFGGWGLAHLSRPVPTPVVVEQPVTQVTIVTQVVAGQAAVQATPTAMPQASPTAAPKPVPTAIATAAPTEAPTATPTLASTAAPTSPPTAAPMPTEGPTAASAESTLPLQLAPGVTLELVRVPAGEFLMGSDKTQDPQAWDDELPQQRVNLPEFWVGKYDVTVAQFAAFVQATGYKTTAEQQGSAYALTGSGWVEVKGADWQHPEGPGSDVSSKQDHPVTQVSWRDAVAFCTWATKVAGRTIRLPSEAEWEKAARGTDGRIYPWGNAAPDASLANFDMNVKDTTPVGQYAAGASPYGALDMAGNVLQWTSSLYKGYPYQAGDGREDPNDPGARVLRGGSFLSESRNVRCAFRNRDLPEDRNDYIGFRVASPGL